MKKRTICVALATVFLALGCAKEPQAPACEGDPKRGEKVCEIVCERTSSACDCKTFCAGGEPALEAPPKVIDLSDEDEGAEEPKAEASISRGVWVSWVAWSTGVLVVLLVLFFGIRSLRRRESSPQPFTPGPQQSLQAPAKEEILELEPEVEPEPKPAPRRSTQDKSTVRSGMRPPPPSKKPSSRPPPPSQQKSDPPPSPRRSTMGKEEAEAFGLLMRMVRITNALAVLSQDERDGYYELISTLQECRSRLNRLRGTNVPKPSGRDLEITSGVTDPDSDEEAQGAQRHVEEWRAHKEALGGAESSVENTTNAYREFLFRNNLEGEDFKVLGISQKLASLVASLPEGAVKMEVVAFLKTQEEAIPPSALATRHEGSQD